MTNPHSSLGEPGAPEQLVGLLTTAARAIAAAEDLAAAVGILAELAVEQLAADLAGVSSFDRRGRHVRLADTDGRLRLVDMVAGIPDSPLAGPLAPGAVILVRDVVTDRRWPEWGAALRAHGARSALLVGLPVVQGRPATLELYGTLPDAVTRLDRVAVAHVATHVGLAVEQAERRWNLEEAMQSRGLIGQAQGIVMERYRLTGAQAMAYLRRQSQRSQLKIRELAADIVRDREREADGAAWLDGT